MSPAEKCENWKAYAVASGAILVAITVVAFATKLWVLTAIPVGFLFGFFLQKGDLCGASAFSEVLLMKDWRKIWGLWVCIVTGMVGFAVLGLLGWVKLNPKPFIWLNYVIGGAIFGVGTVLAGGCVSGTLFKAGIGHINSIIALLSIALGVALVEHGPLAGVYAHAKQFVIKANDGGSVTLSSLTGLPFWALAAIIAVITVLSHLMFCGRKRANAEATPEQPSSSWWSDKLTARSWRPWHAGFAIGLLGMLAYLSSAACGRNYPFGVTHGVLHAQLLLTDTDLRHVWRKPSRPQKTAVVAKPASEVAAPASNAVAAPVRKKVSWWLIAEVISLVAGSWVAAKLSGQARLLPKPPEQIVIGIVGGFLVGVGAAFAKGCVVGNIMSGWALMSMGTVVFGVVTVLANWATTYLYMMGGTIFPSDD